METFYSSSSFCTSF